MSQFAVPLQPVSVALLHTRKHGTRHPLGQELPASDLFDVIGEPFIAPSSCCPLLLPFDPRAGRDEDQRCDEFGVQNGHPERQAAPLGIAEQRQRGHGAQTVRGSRHGVLPVGSRSFHPVAGEIGSPDSPVEESGQFGEHRTALREPVQGGQSRRWGPEEPFGHRAYSHAPCPRPPTSITRPPGR